MANGNLPPFQPAAKVKLTALVLISAAVIFGFFTRIISVFEYVTFDIGPDPDQINCAYILMDMWQGKFPHLGGAGAGGAYHFSVPNLYAYLVFPFTVLGADPAFQALANGFFSFLSILLLMHLVYQLLENVDAPKRLLLAGLAGFWYSSIFADYFISNFTWGPSPIPFFILVLALLYKFQVETNKSLLHQAVSWTIYGIVLAILVSLHTTTLFVVPVVFIVSSLWFVYKNRRNLKKCLLPLLACISANIALLLYWKLEIARHFINTRQIFSLITGSGVPNGQMADFFDRLFRVLYEYVFLGNQVYFLSDGYSLVSLLLSIIFLSLTLYYGIVKFKGNKAIFGFLGLTWLIFLCSSFYYREEYFHTHRKIIIWFAPMLMAVSSLAYLDFSKIKGKVISVFLTILIIFSIGTNLRFDFRYLCNKYGPTRLLSVADVVNIFNKLPAGSTIFYPEKENWKRRTHNQYDYIDTYMTKRGFKIVSACESGSYMIQPKFKMVIPSWYMFPIFTISKTPKFGKKTVLFLETPEAYVYRILTC